MIKSSDLSQGITTIYYINIFLSSFKTRITYVWSVKFFSHSDAMDCVPADAEHSFQLVIVLPAGQVPVSMGVRG